MEKLKLIGELALVVFIRTIIIVGVACMVGFLLSKGMNKDFSKVLEYVGVLILGIGLLSIFGDMGARADKSTNITKFLVGSDTMLNAERAITRSGYIFAIYTSLSGLVILSITVLMYLNR